VDRPWRLRSTLGDGGCPGNEGTYIHNLFQSGQVETQEDIEQVYKLFPPLANKENLDAIY